MEPPPDGWEEEKRGTAWFLVSGSLKALSHSPPLFQVPVIWMSWGVFLRELTNPGSKMQSPVLGGGAGQLSQSPQKQKIRGVEVW